MTRKSLLPTLVALALVCLPATSAWSQHVVDVSLTSPSNGQTVAPGAIIEWTVAAQISAGGSPGLALIATDLIAAVGNPAPIDLVPADAVPSGMEMFAPPDGVTNPGEGPIRAYGGTLYEGKLLQIGGGQNNGGAVPVDGGVATSPQVVATGSFVAPAALGEYTVSLVAPIGNVFSEINDVPAFSPAVAANVGDAGQSFTFTVADSGCVCGDIDGSGGPVELADFATLALCYGLVAPSLPDCDPDAFACSDLDGDMVVDLADFATFATWFGIETTQKVPDCEQ